MSVNHFCIKLLPKPSFAASSDYGHGAIPASIWLSSTNASQCLSIPTFPSDDASEQYQILVMPRNLTIVITILKLCIEGAVRLVGGGDGSAGRLEVCRDGVYRTICDTTWTMHNTLVACNQLGFSPAQGKEMHAVTNMGSGPIALDGVNCTGSESDILSCPSSGNANACSHDVWLNCSTENLEDFNRES